MSWTLTAKEDADSLLDTDDITIDGYNFGSNNHFTTKTVTVRIVDNDDTADPTVVSASSGYFENAAATTPMTGPVTGADDIYTKVVFSEAVLHNANDGPSARPQISYKVGDAAAVQYDIVANTANLGHGDCRPTAAPPTTTYVCRYTSPGTEDGNFDFRVGTKTEDRAGRQLATAYVHATKLLIDNNDPAYSSSKVDGKTLEVTFSEALDATSKPEVTAFTVTVGSNAAAYPRSYTLVGSKATFTLARPVGGGTTVTVAYTKPSGNNAKVLKDSANFEVANFSEARDQRDGEHRADA